MSSSLRHLRRPQQASSLKRPPQQRVCLSSSSAATNKQQVRANRALASTQLPIAQVTFRTSLTCHLSSSYTKAAQFQNPNMARSWQHGTCIALPHVR